MLGPTYKTLYEVAAGVTAQGPACCRKQFDLVRQGVEAAAAALRVERERSLLVRGVSTRVIRRFAFVAIDPFATWFKTSIESLIPRTANGRHRTGVNEDSE